jgi:uncharacterized protein (DUF4415 family)
MSQRKIVDKGDPNAVFDEDNPEWTAEDFRRARPAYELLPEILAAFPNTRRGPQKEETKVPVSIRLSADVVRHFKAGGPGWQTRIDDALKDSIASSDVRGFSEPQAPAPAAPASKPKR